MSAIGDTILSARTQLQARDKGYTPFLLTSASNESLVHCMPQLHGACLMSSSGFTFLTRIHGSTMLTEVDADRFFKILQSKSNMNVQFNRKNITYLPIADLQATRRSKCAIADFEKMLNSQNIRTKKYVARKLSFWRILLVIWSFFARKQWSGRKPPQWLQKKLKPVRELQKELLDKLPHLSGENSKPEERILLSPEPQVAVNSPMAANIHAPHIVLLLGSSFRLKSWPQEHFRKLIGLVLSRTPLNIVLCGGREDQNVGSYLTFQNSGRIIDLTGRTTLSETLALIKSATYIVTGDSFASHAADLLGTPASVLFGSTHPLFGFEPEGAHTFVHHAGLSCSPCSRHGQGHCRFKNIRCLTSIKPEEVFSKIEQTLTQNRQKPDASLPPV
jgi:heptosyltransferase-2